MNNILRPTLELTVIIPGMIQISVLYILQFSLC